MTSDDSGTSAPSNQPVSPPLNAGEALGEIDRVTRRVRGGVYWEAAQWIIVAVFLPASMLILRASDPRDSRGVLIAWVAVLLVIAALLYLQSRQRAVHRRFKMRTKILGGLCIGLYLGCNFALEQTGPHGISPWVVVIAVVPALPALFGAAWVLRR